MWPAVLFVVAIAIDGLPALNLPLGASSDPGKETSSAVGGGVDISKAAGVTETKTASDEKYLKEANQQSSTGTTVLQNTPHKDGTTTQQESLLKSDEGSEDSDEFSSHTEYSQGYQDLLNGFQARSSLVHRGPIRPFSHISSHGPSETLGYNQYRNYASENGHYGSRTSSSRRIGNLGTHNSGQRNGFWNHAYNSEHLAPGVGNHRNNHFVSGTGIRHQRAGSEEYIDHAHDASQFSEGGYQDADASKVNFVDSGSDSENQETNPGKHDSGNVSDESETSFDDSGYVDESYRRGFNKGVNTDQFVSEPENEEDDSGQYVSRAATDTGDLKEVLKRGLNKRLTSVSATGNQENSGKYNAIARHGNGYQGNANRDLRGFLNRPHFGNQRVNPGYLNGVFAPTDNINYRSGNGYHTSPNEYLNELLNHARDRLNYPGPVKPRPVPFKYINGGFASGGHNDQYDIEDDEEESQDANVKYLSDILTQAQYLLKHGAVPKPYGVTPTHHHPGPQRKPLYETPNLGKRFYDTPTGSYIVNPASTAEYDDDTYGGVAPGYAVPAVIVPELNGYPNGQYYEPNYYRNGGYGSGPSYIPVIDRSGPTTIFGRNPSVLPLSTIPVSNVANIDNAVVIDKTLTFEALPRLNPFKPFSPLTSLTPLNIFDTDYEGTSRDASEIIIDKNLLRGTFESDSGLKKDGTTTAINKDLTSKITQTTYPDSYNDENSIIDNGVRTDKTVLSKETGKPVKGNEKIDEASTKITKEKTDDDKLVATGKDDDKTIINPGKSIIIDKNTVNIYNHGGVNNKYKTVKSDEKVLETNEKSGLIEKKDGGTINYDKSNKKTATKKDSGKDNKPNSNDNDEIRKTGKSYVIDKTLVINTINKDNSGKENKDQTSTKTREVSGTESKSETLDKSDEGMENDKTETETVEVKNDSRNDGSHVIGKADDKTTKPVKVIVIQNNLGTAEKSDITNNDVNTSDKNTEIKNADKDRNGSDKKDKTLEKYVKLDEIDKINDVIKNNGKSTVTENTDNQGKDNVKTPKTDANVEKALETDETSNHHKDGDSIKSGESIVIEKTAVIKAINKDESGMERIDETSTQTKEVVDSNDQSDYEITKNSKSKENKGLKDSDAQSETVEKIKKQLGKHDKPDDIAKDNDGNTKLVNTIVIDKDTVIKNFLKKYDRQNSTGQVDKETTKKGKLKVTEDTDEDLEQNHDETDYDDIEKDDTSNDEQQEHGSEFGDDSNNEDGGDNNENDLFGKPDRDGRSGSNGGKKVIGSEPGENKDSDENHEDASSNSAKSDESGQSVGQKADKVENDDAPEKSGEDGKYRNPGDKKVVGSENAKNNDPDKDDKDASSNSDKSGDKKVVGYENNDKPKKSGEVGKSVKNSDKINENFVELENRNNKDYHENAKDASSNSKEDGKSERKRGHKRRNRRNHTNIGKVVGDKNPRGTDSATSENNGTSKDDLTVTSEKPKTVQDENNNTDAGDGSIKKGNNDDDHTSDKDDKSGKKHGHKRRIHTNIGKVVGDKNPRGTDTTTSENDGTSKDDNLTVASEKPKTGQDENNNTNTGDSSIKKVTNDDDQTSDKDDKSGKKHGHKRRNHTNIGKVVGDQNLSGTSKDDNLTVTSEKPKTVQDENNYTNAGDGFIKKGNSDDDQTSDKVDKSGTKHGHKRRNHTNFGKVVGDKNPRGTDSATSENDGTSKDDLTVTSENPKTGQDENNNTNTGDGSIKKVNNDDDQTSDKDDKSGKKHGHKRRNHTNIGKVVGDKNPRGTDSATSENDGTSKGDNLTVTSEKPKTGQDENNYTTAGDGFIKKGNNDDDHTSDKDDKSGKKHGHKRRNHTSVGKVVNDKNLRGTDSATSENDETSKDDNLTVTSEKPKTDQDENNYTNAGDGSIKEGNNDDDHTSDKDDKSGKKHGHKRRNHTNIGKVVGDQNLSGTSKDDNLTVTSEKPKTVQDENNYTNAGDGFIKKGNSDDDQTSDKVDKSGTKHGHKRRNHTNFGKVVGDKNPRGTDSATSENDGTSKDDLTVTSENPKTGQDENNNTNTGDGSIKKINNDDDQTSYKDDKSGKKHGHKRRNHTNIGKVVGDKNPRGTDSATSENDGTSKGDNLTVTSEKPKTGQDENNYTTAGDGFIKKGNNDDDHTSDKDDKSGKKHGHKRRNHTSVGKVVNDKNLRGTDSATSENDETSKDDNLTVTSEKPKTDQDENNYTNAGDGSIKEGNNDDDHTSDKDDKSGKKHGHKRRNHTNIGKVVGDQNLSGTSKDDNLTVTSEKPKTGQDENNDAKEDEGEQKIKKVVESGTDSNYDDDDIVTGQSGKDDESVGKGDQNYGKNLGFENGENVDLEEDRSEKSEKEIHGRKHKKSHKSVGKKRQKKYQETDLLNNDNSETSEGVKSTEMNEKPVSDKPGQGKNNSDKTTATESKMNRNHGNENCEDTSREDSNDYDEGKLYDKCDKGGKLGSNSGIKGKKDAGFENDDAPGKSGKGGNHGKNGSSQVKAIGSETGNSKTPNVHVDDDAGVAENGERIHGKKHKKPHKVVESTGHKKNNETDLLNIENTETFERQDSTDIKKKTTSDKPGQEENKNNENEETNGEDRENSDDDDDELSKRSGKGGRFVKKDKNVTESENDDASEKSEGISGRHGGKQDKAIETKNGNKAYTKEHSDDDKDAAEKSHKGGRIHDRKRKHSHKVRKVVERKGLNNDQVTDSAHNENDGVSKQVKSTDDGKKSVSDENSEDQKDETVNKINKEVVSEKGDRLPNKALDGETNEDGKQTEITDKKLRIRDYRRKIKNNKKDVTQTKKDLQPSNVSDSGPDDRFDDGGEHSKDNNKLTDQNTKPVNRNEKHKIVKRKNLRNHESGDHSDSDTTEKSKSTSNTKKVVTEETDNNDKNDKFFTINDGSGHLDETSDNSNSTVKDKQSKTKKHNHRDTTNNGNKDNSSQMIRNHADTKDKDESKTDANTSKDKTSNEKDNNTADKTIDDLEQGDSTPSTENDDAVSKNTDSEKDKNDDTKRDVSNNSDSTIKDNITDKSDKVNQSERKRGHKRRNQTKYGTIVGHKKNHKIDFTKSKNEDTSKDDKLTVTSEKPEPHQDEKNDSKKDGSDKSDSPGKEDADGSVNDITSDKSVRSHKHRRNGVYKHKNPTKIRKIVGENNARETDENDKTSTINDVSGHEDETSDDSNSAVKGKQSKTKKHIHRDTTNNGNKDNSSQMIRNHADTKDKDESKTDANTSKDKTSNEKDNNTADKTIDDLEQGDSTPSTENDDAVSKNTDSEKDKNDDTKRDVSNNSDSTIKDNITDKSDKVNQSERKRGHKRRNQTKYGTIVGHKKNHKIDFTKSKNEDTSKDDKLTVTSEKPEPHQDEKNDSKKDGSDKSDSPGKEDADGSVNDITSDKSVRSHKHRRNGVYKHKNPTKIRKIVGENNARETDENDKTSTINDVSGHEDETSDDSNSAVKGKQSKTKKHIHRDTTNNGNKDNSSQVIRKHADTKDKDESKTDANTSEDKTSNEKDNNTADKTIDDFEQEDTTTSTENDGAVSKNTDSEKEDTSDTKNTVVINTSKAKPKNYRRATDLATKTRNLTKRKLATITITIKQHKPKLNIEDTNNNFAGKTNADSTSGKTTETDDGFRKTEEINNRNTADNNSSDNCGEEKSSSTSTHNKIEKSGSQSDESSSSSTISAGESKTASTDTNQQTSVNQSDESNSSSNETADRQSKDEANSKSYKNREEESSESASGYGSGAEQESLTKDGEYTTYKKVVDDSAHFERQEDSKYTEESKDSNGETVESGQKNASEEGNNKSSDSYIEETDSITKKSKKDSARAEDEKNQASSSSDYKKVDSNGNTAARKSSSRRKSFQYRQSSYREEEYNNST